MTTQKAPVIKLNPTEDGIFERESYYGLGPFKAKVNDDDSLTLGIPNQEPEICTPSENEHGQYWMFNIYGGKGFASVVNHEKYGRYLRLRLGNGVELPPEVTAKLNGNGGAKGGKSGGFKGYKKTTKVSNSNDLWS